MLSAVLVAIIAVPLYWDVNENQYGIFLYCLCILDWLFWHGIKNKRADWLLAGQHHVCHPVSITVL